MAVEKYASKENLARFKSNYDTEIASAIATAVAQKIAKIASATGGKIAVTTATGEVSESGTAVNDLATKAFVGNIPATASATTVIDYINEVTEDIVADLAGVLKFKGVVATVADLPASGNENGDVYHVTAASAEYVWLAPEGATASWEELGSVIDPSAYSTTTEMNTAIGAAIQTAIEGLDSSASQTAGADGLALSITIVDGAVTAITGSIAANTYDAYGAAATAKSEVIGTSGDTASASTVNGAKAYADSLAVNYDAAGSAATAKSDVIGTSADAGTDDTVYGAKAYAKGYADGLASNYATSAQGAKADTALQPSDVEPLSNDDIDDIFSAS
jgi:hypothetical protein